MTDKKTTLFSLKSEFEELVKRIEVLENKKVEVKLDDSGQTVDPTKTITSATQFETPIPMDYRMIVDEVLNKNFGIKIVPRNDAPLFEFIVIVPDKYSNATEEQKKDLGGDLRVKVLNYADGANGVREWCQKIYDSFSQEIKGLITADKI